MYHVFSSPPRPPFRYHLNFVRQNHHLCLLPFSEFFLTFVYFSCSNLMYISFKFLLPFLCFIVSLVFLVSFSFQRDSTPRSIPFPSVRCLVYSYVPSLRLVFYLSLEPETSVCLDRDGGMTH